MINTTQCRSRSSAAERNSAPILAVLRDEIRDGDRVLEIGSGTGQHALAFSAALPVAEWQTSDLAVNHETIKAWLGDCTNSPLKPPLELDVMTAQAPTSKYDVVFSANTAHIMSKDAVAAMFEFVAQVIGSDGRFILYGPFRFADITFADSNAAFDRSLRDRNPAMGIRSYSWLQELGAAHALIVVRRYAMPANNSILVWQIR